MVVVHAGQTPQPWLLRGVAAINVPGGTRLRDFAAHFHRLLGGGAQALDPTVREELLQQNEAVGEIKLALLLREDAGFCGKDLFGRHEIKPLG
jgi:hypothetical protein